MPTARRICRVTCVDVWDRVGEAQPESPETCVKARGALGCVDFDTSMDSPPPALTVSPATAPSNSGDKALIILCHLSAFLGVGFILPLIVYLIKKDEPGPAAAHAREVLNFHLSLLLYAVCAIPLVFVVVGVPLLMLIALASFVCAIVAAVKASDGVLYRYPCSIRFIS